MGTTSISQQEKMTRIEVRNFLLAEFYPNTIISFSLKQNEMYLAVQNSQFQVQAYAVKFRNTKNEFSYKIMHESMHPFCYDCPNKILNVLSPTEEKYALAWRQANSQKKRAIYK